ncbi:MAG: SPASM domain-containing protein [Polyangiales bacterium]
MDTHANPGGADLRAKFCEAPFRQFETLVDGNVAPCCSLWVEERIGNVDRQPFEEIWNGEAARRIRESIHDGSFRYCRKDRCAHIIHGTLPDRDAVTDPEMRAVIDARATRLAHAPRRLFLAHDPTCNLSCPSCRDGMLAADEAGEARLDVIERTVLRPILDAGEPVELSLSGQGDPWSSRHYRSVLRHLAAHDLNVKLNLHTNGLLMTPGRWAEYQGLEKYRPLVNVSIDACRPWTYAVLRRGGEWARLEANLRFIASKRREGAVSAFFLNATVQLDNFHELADMVALGAELGCDGVRFYLIQNTGGHLADDYARKNVAAPDHPLHLAFLETLRDPALGAPLAHLYDVHTAREAALAATLPSDVAGVASAQDCVAGFHLYMNAGDPERAAAVAAHGCWRFPEQGELRVLAAAALETLGFADQAEYRYRECLRRDPDDFNALVALGTRLIEGDDLRGGLRQLVAAASTTRDPAVLDGITDYIVKFAAPPRRVRLPVHP